MATVTITDESTLGDKRSWDLDILEEALPLAELIRRRIYQEVTEYNAKQVGYYYGLVQPTEAERALNGYQVGAASFECLGVGEWSSERAQQRLNRRA